MRGATRQFAGGGVEIEQFQSTPLMRGATNYRIVLAGYYDVSIHAPHARGDLDSGNINIEEIVSIHAPHARGDLVR